MFIDKCYTTGPNGKKYSRILLRDSYRDENGKVQHNTIANLSKCSPIDLHTITLALKNKDKILDLFGDENNTESFYRRQGRSVGAIYSLYTLAERIGIVDALGKSRQGKLALWQVIARAIDQGSRLSAVRLAKSHAACEIIKMDAFDEDDLYENLDWLSENQSKIEDQLLNRLYPGKKPELFLYDVTSSYLEGTENELASFGYNRDGKKGKMQIVAGLLCDQNGTPLSIEIFEGNTQDPQTFYSQIQKVATRLGGHEVTFVGDRGMIKNRQTENLHADPNRPFHYITAITKPQINTLLHNDIIQIDLFDSDVAEVVTQEGIRYILRRNPYRAVEMHKNRCDKLSVVKQKAAMSNMYLEKHPRATVIKQMDAICHKIRQLKLNKWVHAEHVGRCIEILIDDEELHEIEKLDGCYVLKTDLTVEKYDKQCIHDRYLDLRFVEEAFRTCKTVLLELRPIYLRKEARTRGHAFVVMMAYRLIRVLAVAWRDFNCTIQEGIQELATLCSTELVMQNGEILCNWIPCPRPSVKELLEALHVYLPKAFANGNVKVDTRRKLTERRKKK